MCTRMIRNHPPLSSRQLQSKIIDSRKVYVADRSSEQYSNVSSQLWSSSTRNEAPESAKQASDAPPVFETIDQLLMPFSRNERPVYVRFDLYCDINCFIDGELEGQPNLASVLTLSGTVEKAFAATCEDYVQLFWPEYGLSVLQQFCLAIQKLDCTGANTLSSIANLFHRHTNWEC